MPTDHTDKEQTAMQMLIDYLRMQKDGIKGNSSNERARKGAYTDAIVAATSLLAKEGEDKKNEAINFADGLKNDYEWTEKWGGCWIPKGAAFIAPDEQLATEQLYQLFQQPL